MFKRLLLSDCVFTGMENKQAHDPTSNSAFLTFYEHNEVRLSAKNIM